VYFSGLAKVGMAVRRAAIQGGLASAITLQLVAGAAGLSALGLAGGLGQAHAKAPPEGPPAVALASLPAEARTTYQLIHAGGPFPYAKDGTVFLNRERHLPAKNRGYYREYTVKTPRSRDRGARRIVCGGPSTAPQACYYTADHYASFSLITQP